MDQYENDIKTKITLRIKKISYDIKKIKSINI